MFKVGIIHSDFYGIFLNFNIANNFKSAHRPHKKAIGKNVKQPARRRVNIKSVGIFDLLCVKYNFGNKYLSMRFYGARYECCCVHGFKIYCAIYHAVFCRLYFQFGYYQNQNKQQYPVALAM